ncbi:hypothetical protein ABPG74_012928 [Tetrahymena malaccensis]
MNSIQYDDEKSALEKMQSSLRNVIFEVLYYVINQTEQFSILIYIIFVLIETFQILYWYFTTDIVNLWIVMSVADDLQKFFSYFLLVPYFNSFSQMIVGMYVIIGIFGCLLLLILYVSIKIKNGISGLSGALSVIKIFCQLSLSFLYLPMFDLFLSPMRCRMINGAETHKIFQDQQCYSGNNLLHSFFGLVSAIVLFCIVYLITLTNFESRYQPNRTLLKLSGREDVKLLFFKTILVVSFTFLDTTDLLILVIIFITLCTLDLFLTFNKSSNILNYMYNKVINSQIACIFWTTLILIFGQIMVFTNFRGVVYIWLIGLPFLIFIVFMRREYRYDLMMVDSNKFDSLNQAVSQILYLTRCLNYYNTDRNMAAILDGFVDYHRTICNRDDCPCQAKNMNQKKIKKFIKNARAGQFDDEIKEKFVVLVYLIERIFVLALTRFPGCTQLRVNHALFLLDKMKSTQQSLSELDIAQQEKPYLDEQFMIFRYKKLIEDSMLEARKNTNANQESANEITADNAMKEIMLNIEQSTMLHIDFWSQLSEDTPDLSRVYEIGIKLNYANNLVKESWKKQMKLNSDISPNQLRTYARYLLDVLNDKDQAYEVIQKLKSAQSTNVDRSKTTNNINEFQNESTGLISVSAEDVSFARISGLNQTAAMYFGYSKSELINRKVNLIMPQVFADHHDSFLEDYLHHLESKVLNRERLLFGKAKNGYIFPSYMYVRYVPSYIHGTQFIASIRIEKYFKLIGFMIITKGEFEIVNITSNCITLFDLSLGILNKKKPCITDLIPEFSLHTKEFQAKGGYDIHIDIGNQEEQQLYNVQIKEIVFRGGLGLQGYEVRFEKQVNENKQGTDQMGNETLRQPDQNNNLLTTGRSKLNPQNQNKFVLKYDYENHQFCGEYNANIVMSNVNNLNQNSSIKGSHIQNSPKEATANNEIAINFSTYQIDQSNREKDKQDEEDMQKMNVEYAKGIRTVRLVKGQLLDVDELRRDEMEDEEEEEEEHDKKFDNLKNDIIKGSKLDELENESSGAGESNAFKNKQKLVQFLSENKASQNNSLEIFKWSGVVLLVILGILAILNYVQSQSLFDSINSQYKVISQSNIRQADVQRILFKIANYELIRLGLLPPITDLTIDQTNLDDTINELQTIQQYIVDNSSNMGSSQQDFFNSATINLYNSQSGQVSTQKTDMNQATYQYISKSLNLVNLQISDYTSTLYPEIFFVEYNGLNDFQQSLFQSSNYYTQDLNSYIKSKNSLFVTYLIVSIVVVVLSFICIAPIFSFVNKNQESVLKLFLEIPVAQVKLLFSRCEQFQNGMQMGEDDNVSEMDDLVVEDEDGGDYGIGRKRKKRKFKFESIEKRNFIIKFLLSLLLLESYFIATYFVSTSLQSSLSQLVTEFNYTCQAEPYYTYINNALRKFFIDQSFNINLGNGANLIQVALQQLNDINTNIHTEHAKNIGSHTSTYNNYFESINDLNACTVMESLNIQKATDCAKFAVGIVQEGMGPGTIRHFENIRYLITLYSNFANDASQTFPAEENKPDSSLIPVQGITDVRKLRIANILSINSAIEINTMQDVYIRNLQRSLVTSFLQDISSQISSNQTTRVTIFICFMVLLVCVYIVFWIPLVTKITRETARTTAMLSLIPLKIIVSVKAIKDYLNKFLKIE